MPTYGVTFARSARRDIERLPLAIARRILARIENLGDEPRPQGCRKLRGPSRLWRIRVGEYRVVYGIDDRNHAIDVVIVRHRGEVYR